MSKKLIIIGGRGKGEQIFDCVTDNRNNFGDTEYDVVGFLNDFETEKICGLDILGKLDDIENFIHQDYYFCFAIHPIGHNQLVSKLIKRLNIPDRKLAKIVSKRAFISHTSNIGPGAVVLAFAYISLHVQIGKCAMVMAKVAVGHNSIIGECSFLGAGSTLGSNVKMGASSSVGIGATILEGRSLGDCSILGAGSMLLKDIPSNQIFVGNPAKFLKLLHQDE